MWGLLSRSRAMSPRAQHLGLEGWLGRQEPHHGPSALPLLFQFQAQPPPPPLPTRMEPRTHSHILPGDSGSWPEGPQAWNKQRNGGRGGEGVWGQDPPNK